MPARMTTAELFGNSAAPAAKRTLSTKELFGAQESKAPKGMSYEGSALHGLGQSASFGYADEGLAAAKAVYDKMSKGKDFSEAYPERLKVEREELERARTNPKSYIGGAVLGGAATSIIPGLGWANVGKSANIAGQMGKAALLGGLMGSGESEGNLLENQGQLVKDVALGAGTGAITQGILAGGAKAIKAIPAFSRQKAAERAVKATTGQNIGAIRKMGGTTHASAGDIEKFAAGVRKVGNDIIDEVTPSGKPLLGAFDSVEDLAPKMAEARKFYGEKLGSVGKAVDAFYPKGAVSGQNIANKLQTFAESIPETENGKALADKLMREAANFEKLGNMTFDKAKLYKNQFAFKPADADILVGNKDVINKIRSIIGGEMDETADALASNLGKVKSQGPISVTSTGGIPPSLGSKADPLTVSPENFQKVEQIKDLLNKYGLYKGKYGSFKQAADAATDRAQKNLSNRFVSPSDYGVGSATAAASAVMTGNPAMLLMGVAGAAANKLARERGSSMAAVSLRKIAEAAKSPIFVNKYTKALLDAAGKGPAAMLATHGVLMNSDPDYRTFFKEDY